MNKSICIAAFGLLLSSTVFAGTLGEEAEKCFSLLSEAKVKACAIEKDCNASAVKDCFLKLNPSFSKCELGYRAAFCHPAAASELFPGLENCAIRFDKWSKDRVGRAGAANIVSYGTLEKKSCKVHKYELSNDQFSLATAVRDDKNKWQLPPMGFPVGLEKAVPADAVQVLEMDNGTGKLFQKEIEKPCERGGLSKYLPTDRNGIDDDMRKALGFGNEEDLYYERHFAPRNTPSGFPAIFSFRLKHSVKVCGATIPSGTVLQVRFDSDACKAITDGALGIAGLPKESFSQFKAEQRKGTVKCDASAQRTSYIGTLLETAEKHGGKVTVPKIDWQKCDCQFSEE